MLRHGGYDTLDIMVGGFRFLGIDYENIIIFIDGTDIPLDQIAIEHQNDRCLLGAFIIREDIHQPLAGAFQTDILHQLSQFAPCVDNIIAIHKQKFLCQQIPLLSSVDILLGGAVPLTPSQGSHSLGTRYHSMVPQESDKRI